MKKPFLNPSIVLTVSFALLVSNLSAATHYVDANGMNPIPPYTNWITAATDIRDAVSVASAGDTIIVTNGVYPGTVTLTNSLALRSVNGPQFTLINGGGTNRCLYLTTNGASLTGFTFTNGAVAANGVYGGGVYCASTNAFLTNCVITGNRAKGYVYRENTDVIYIAGKGGGVYGCTLYNCIVNGNYAQGGGWNRALPSQNPIFSASSGGGVFGGILFNCILTGNSANAGGGAANCTLYNCTLTGNVCSDSSLAQGTMVYHYFGSGGGAAGGALYNCLLASNSAHGGGGAANCTLYDCTLTGNSCGDGLFGANYPGHGGGAASGTLFNCIAYFNSATLGPNYDTNYCVLNYCCTTPLLTNGIGNITNAPLFVNTNGWSNLHLQTNSPGINAGNNDYVVTATDLDGNPRIAGGTVDMGAYEFQPGVCGGRCDGAVCSPGAGFGFVFCGATVGQPYRIQISANLAASSWTDLTNFIYTGPIVITDPSVVAGTKKFYRAVSP